MARVDTRWVERDDLVPGSREFRHILDQDRLPCGRDDGVARRVSAEQFPRFLQIEPDRLRRVTRQKHDADGQPKREKRLILLAREHEITFPRQHRWKRRTPHHGAQRDAKARGKARSFRHRVFAGGKAGQARLTRDKLCAAFLKQLAEKSRVVVVRMGEQYKLDAAQRRELTESLFVRLKSARITGIERDPTQRRFEQILPQKIAADLVNFHLRGSVFHSRAPRFPNKEGYSKKNSTNI